LLSLHYSSIVFERAGERQQKRDPAVGVDLTRVEALERGPVTTLEVVIPLVTSRR
jgi:hypothetical protein